MNSNPSTSGSPKLTPVISKTKAFKPPGQKLLSSQLPSTPATLARDSVKKVSKESIEDKKLANELRLLNNELTRQIGSYKTDDNQLKQSIKILKNYGQEVKTMGLIDKWRSISQAGMSYMLNSTKVKISKIGGYEELKRKEVEAEKRKIEYQVDSSLQDQMDDVLESEEFQMLPEEEQGEFKRRMQDKIEEMELWKERALEKLENEMQLSTNQEMTMQELAHRLKIDYHLVFPEVDA